MKKIISFVLATALLFCSVLISANAYTFDHRGDAVTDENAVYKTSKDGKYHYAVNEQTGQACFWRSSETDITVLEIPDEIDGCPITEVSRCLSSSPSLVRVKFGKNIKYALTGSLDFYSRNPSGVFLCNIDLNEGLEEICVNASDYYWAGREVRAIPRLEVLVLPKSLKFVGTEGISSSRVRNLIVQSNFETDKHAVSHNDTMEKRGYLDFYWPGCKMYLTSDITNFDDFALNYKPWYDFEDFPPYLETTVNKYMTIYKTPDTKGVEKFEKMGYPVEEYTEEWWHDLAEIEEVTMTAEGMSEKTEQVGNGLSDSARKYLSHEYEKSIKSGEKFTVSSAFAPSDAYDDRTFFVSMDETVATVDTETGEVTALKKGTARIRCVAASGVFSDCILKVDGGDNTNGVYPLTNYYEKTIVAKETTLFNEVTTDPDLSANQTKPTDWKEFFFANKLYIIIPVAAAAILAAAVIVIKKKKR